MCQYTCIEPQLRNCASLSIYTLSHRVREGGKEEEKKGGTEGGTVHQMEDIEDEEVNYLKSVVDGMCTSTTDFK